MWCVTIGLSLIWIDHHLKLKKFQIFALYCMAYTAGRFVFEEMRIDPAHTIGPLRLNAWVSIVVFVSALAWFLWLNRHGAPVERPDPHDESVPDVSTQGTAPESA